MTASLKNKLLVLVKLVSTLITAILVLWLLNTVKGCGWKWHGESVQKENLSFGRGTQ